MRTDSTQPGIETLESPWLTAHLDMTERLGEMEGAGSEPSDSGTLVVTNSACAYDGKMIKLVRVMTFGDSAMVRASGWTLP